MGIEERFNVFHDETKYNFSLVSQDINKMTDYINKHHNAILTTHKKITSLTKVMKIIAILAMLNILLLIAVITAGIFVFHKQQYKFADMDDFIESQQEIEWYNSIPENELAAM